MTALIVGAVVVGGLVVLMYISAVLRSKDANKDKPLAVPVGSIRSLLAILIVGGFVVFLLFGSEAIENEDTFDKILAAFASLAGAATGFYFGSRPQQP